MQARSEALQAVAVRLTVRFPFWTEVFYSLTPHELEPDNEMGVDTLATDGRNLWICKPYFEALPLEQKVGVIVHELCHKIFLHTTRRGSRDPKMWNYACVGKGTRVKMADGTLRQVEDVRGGEYVKTPVGAARVLLNTSVMKADGVELCLDNGAKLRCSLDHKVLTYEGFVEAGALREGSSVLVDARTHPVRAEQLQHDDSAADSCRAGGHLPASGFHHDPQQNHPRPGGSVSGHLGVGGVRDVGRQHMGVHGRHCGRGGDNFYCPGDGEGYVVFPSAPVHRQHVFAPVELAGGVGGQCGIATQYERQLVLSGDRIGLRDRTLVAWDAAVFDREAGAVRARTAVHINSEWNEQAVHTHARNAADIPGGQDYQRARVTAVRRIGAPCEVFDLTTEASCYETEGLISHNCDYAVNNLLVANNFQLPPGGLINKEFDNWTAEKIYDELKDQAKKMQASGGLNADGVPGPQMPAGGFDLRAPELGSEQEVDKYEQGVKQLVERAAAMAKAMGSLPVGIEAGIASAYAPTEEPWYNHLHRFMQALAVGEYSWARLNRRALITHRVFAPLHYNDALGTIRVFVDTSGSCFSAAEQAHFATHINAILAEAKPQRVILSYFDAAVYPGEDVEAGAMEIDLKPKGGGGTDFRPIFSAIEEDDVAPAVVIILTDMMGTFPDHEPGYPVVWADTYGHYEAPFGTTIHVE